MHYTKNYAPYKGHVKRQMAIADCKFYLGDEGFNKAVTSFQQFAHDHEINRKVIREMQFALSFVGIQGYPARALVFHALRTM